MDNRTKGIERAKRTLVICRKYNLRELPTFTRSPKYLLTLYHRANGKTYREIASIYGISFERVRQIQTKTEAIVRRQRQLSEFDKNYLKEVW